MSQLTDEQTVHRLRLAVGAMILGAGLLLVAANVLG